MQGCLLGLRGGECHLQLLQLPSWLPLLLLLTAAACATTPLLLLLLQTLSYLVPLIQQLYPWGEAAYVRSKAPRVRGGACVTAGEGG
jgi:hypothetical protein